eukprot:6925369-Karenia_brevis.AAC.1
MVHGGGSSSGLRRQQKSFKKVREERDQGSKAVGGPKETSQLRSCSKSQKVRSIPNMCSSGLAVKKGHQSLGGSTVQERASKRQAALGKCS